MRFEQLEYLAAVTQHGSLRRASERLHMSQPALSEALRKLENELGVTLLDRRRSGARISRRGRELMGPMVEVLEAVERLRVAAGDQTTTAREVRVGTVSAATSTLLVPAVRDLRRRHPGTTVEVTNTVQAAINEGLVEGVLDLGLVNLLEGDLTPPDMTDTALVHGRPVVVLPAGHPLTEGDSVTVQQLRGEQLVAMRSGYLMHRFTHRLFGHDMPAVSYSTDGAELGKVMVAEGLGVTVLPDFSVVGDVLERSGLITHRPISDSEMGTTEITLVVRSRLGAHAPAPVRDLQVALVRRARASATPVHPARQLAT